MTTTDTGPTPYDTELQHLRWALQNQRSNPDLPTHRYQLALVECRAEGYRRGWAEAKAEDAALLEALNRIITLAMEGTGTPSNVEVWQKVVAIRNVILDNHLGNAIAQATGKE